MKHFQYSQFSVFVVLLIGMLTIRLYASNYHQRQLTIQVERYFCESFEDPKSSTQIKSKQPKSNKEIIVNPSRKKAAESNRKTTAKTNRIKSNKKPKTKPTPKPVANITVECNTADSAQWRQLRGIGPVLSSRIVKFRNRLGGFHSITQLQDVYGLSPETYTMIASHITCNGAVKKIDVAQDEFKAILRHPYINYEEVKGLKNYVRKHGAITGLEALIKATDKPLEEAKKLLPYIMIEPQKT